MRNELASLMPPFVSNGRLMCYYVVAPKQSHRVREGEGEEENEKEPICKVIGPVCPNIMSSIAKKLAVQNAASAYVGAPATTSQAACKRIAGKLAWQQRACAENLMMRLAALIERPVSYCTVKTSVRAKRI